MTTHGGALVALVRDSKAPASPTELVGAAGTSRAGDGGRTRDPRLGKPMLYH